MAKKRNLPPESSQLDEPPLKQHQSEAHQENLPVQEDKENHQVFERSSTSPFGQTNSVFGQNNSSNNPFSPKPFGSTTPFGSQTDSSISGGTSTGVFGAAHTPFLLEFIAALPAYRNASYDFRKQLLESIRMQMVLKQQLEAVGDTSTPAIAFGPTFSSTGAPAFGATSTPAFRATTRFYDGEPSIPFSIGSGPIITEEDGGTSGHERFESRFAIAGANYCLIAVDFTRDHTQISKLSGKSVMAGICGFQADVKALQEVLSALSLKYQGQHKMPMSCPEMHRLFCHFEESHPILQDIILGGLDSEGKGCLFHHIGHGAFAPQVGYSSQNSGSRLTVSPIFKYTLPPLGVLARLSETEAVRLARTVFRSTFPHTGDKLEIVVLNASGIHRTFEDLRKD